MQVARDLRLDSLQLSSYTLRVSASTILSPTPTSTSLVFVQVTRNPNKPLFPATIIDVNIGADREPGDVITTVTASDVDSDDDIFYSLEGDGAALEYFHVDDVSGDVWLRRSVANMNTDKFEVYDQKYFNS